MTTIAIKTVNNHFFSAKQGGGGGGVAADRTEIGPWETFTLIKDDNNQVSFQTDNGHYVYAQNGGGSGIDSDRSQIGNWETFTIVDNGNNTIAIKANNGQYLSARDGGGSVITADRSQIGPWETFTIVYLADLSIELDDIEFSEIDPGSARPSASWQDEIDNTSGGEIEKIISKTITKESTFELSFSETLTVGASAKFQANIPLIGSAETQLSTELSLNSSQTWSTTQGEEYTFSSTVKVPANTNAMVTGILYWLENATVPFVACYWVSAKDKKSRSMYNSEIKLFLTQNGFSGKIVDESQEYRMLVSLNGSLNGSWGTKTVIQSNPIN